MGNRSRIAVAVFAALVFGAVPAACAEVPGGGAGSGPSSAGGSAPLFSAVSTGGERFVLEESLRTRSAVVLNFWGIRCSACLEEMPHLDKIAEEFADRGVAVVGVNADGVEANLLKELMADGEIRPGYPVLVDPDMKIADLYRLAGAPLTLVIDRSGRVRYRHENYRPGDEESLRRAIRDALGEPLLPR